MLFHSILFYAFATILIGAAVGVVFSRNPVHAVMFLVLTFFQSAMLWLLAEAHVRTVQFVHNTFEPGEPARRQFAKGLKLVFRHKCRVLHCDDLIPTFLNLDLNSA